MLDLGISLDIWPWVWLVVAVAFVLVELTVLGGSFMVLPFGVSAFVSSLLAFSDVSVAVQWMVFLLGGGALFLLFWRYQALVQRGNILPPGVGAVRLVGLTGVVTRTIDPGHPEQRGTIAVEGDTWTAVTEGDRSLPEGTPVRITDVEGTHVKVEPTGNTSDGRPGSEAPPPPPEGPA